MTREEFFRDYQWFIDAVRDGAKVEFSDHQDYWRNEIPTGFDLKSNYPFQSEEGQYSYVRPAPKKIRRYKNCVDMMKTLIAEGYRPNTVGDFCSYRDSEPRFDTFMWKHCGREVQADDLFGWRESWIEEVEE